MAKFTDNSGDDWLVEITVLHVDRVKRDVGENLNDALVGVQADGTVGEANLITRLDEDPSLVVSVLYALCADQIRERGLGPEDFARRFAGDVLNLAFAALVEALLAFFRKPNQRAALTAQIRVMERGQRKLLDRWREEEAKLDAAIDRKLDAAIDRELEQLRTRFAPATSTASSTAPPAS